MHYYRHRPVGFARNVTACNQSPKTVEHTADPREVTCKACAATLRQPHNHARWDEAKVIKMRRWSHDPSSEIEVTLVPARYPDDDPTLPGYSLGYEVVVDGVWIGTVDSYMGSLDRPIARGSRIRREGKRRKLWSSQGVGARARSFFGQVSRADAIRDLL